VVVLVVPTAQLSPPTSAPFLVRFLTCDRYFVARQHAMHAVRDIVLLF